MNHIRTIVIAGLTSISALVVPTVAQADDIATEGCTTVDYQGAPLEMCPPREPDPTNCYTGDYQGAPIEICLPTGEKLPEGSTYNGAPVVYHVSKDYVPPATVEVAAPVVERSAPASAPADPAVPDMTWVADYVAFLAW
jgi:hypothetical protein